MNINRERVMNQATHLTYEQALASAAMRKGEPARSEPHIRAAATKAAALKAMRAEKLAALREGLSA